MVEFKFLKYFHCVLVETIYAGNLILKVQGKDILNGKAAVVEVGSHIN